MFVDIERLSEQPSACALFEIARARPVVEFSVDRTFDASSHCNSLTSSWMHQPAGLL